MNSKKILGCLVVLMVAVLVGAVCSNKASAIGLIEKPAVVSCHEVLVGSKGVIPAICITEDISSMDGMAKSVEGMGVTGSLYEAFISSVLVGMYILFVCLCGSDDGIKFN